MVSEATAPMSKVDAESDIGQTERDTDDCRSVVALVPFMGEARYNSIKCQLLRSLSRDRDGRVGSLRKGFVVFH